MTCDLHNHSCYSFDGSASVEALCRAAIRHKIDILAITDHCDMTPGPEGFRSYLHGEPARLEEFAQVQRELGDLELLYGVEIGNAIDMPAQTADFLAKRRFDFIIGAIHFLPGGRDIYRLPYRSEEEIHGMFLRYFASVEALVELGGFDSLAHLDYPLRVLRGKVPAPSIARYRDLVDPILEKLARREIALEINTRGTYDWQHRVGPEEWVLARYRDLGGRYVTIGSDAHTASRIGAGFEDAAALLRRTGFESFTVYRNREPCQILL
ncbi:histidinol-phosphatase HisJ family protein [Dysosmobacter sp.]